MSQVYQLQQFRDAARHAQAAGVSRKTAVQFVRHEQATGRTGQNSVNLLERLAQRPTPHWSEVLA
jgi:hypothetical protein